MKLWKHINNKEGLTLIEIIVAMTIIAIFATLATTRVIGYLGKAKTEATKTQIKTFQQALELYKIDNDSYPTTEQGLQALIDTPTIGNIPQNYPPGGYLQKKQIPKDAWQTPYIYICEDGEKFIIISYGADKKEGGTEKGADISSDDL